MHSHRLRYLFLLTALLLAAAACSYDDTLDVVSVRVQLQYPEGTIEPYAGARVEMTDMHASVFVDSTDASGVAHFALPAGIYQLLSSGTKTTYDYRYIYNGSKGQVVVSPDSLNDITLPLTVTAKRIVH